MLRFSSNYLAPKGKYTKTLKLTLMQTWIWLSKDRVKAIISSCIPYISKVQETVEYLDEMITEYCIGNIENAKKAFEMVVKTERESDEVKRKLIDELSKGIFHAIDRDELLRLVLAIDDIANVAKATAKKLSLILDLRVPLALSGYCMRMCREAVEATTLTKFAFETLSHNPNQVFEFANKVENIEREVDELKIEVLKELRNFINSLDMYTFIVLKDVIELIESISDKCEDVMNILRRLVITSL